MIHPANLRPLIPAPQTAPAAIAAAQRRNARRPPPINMHGKRRVIVLGTRPGLAGMGLVVCPTGETFDPFTGRCYKPGQAPTQVLHTQPAAPQQTTPTPLNYDTNALNAFYGGLRNPQPEPCKAFPTSPIYDVETRARQKTAGIEPVDSGLHKLGTLESILGQYCNPQDARYPRLKQISDCLRQMFSPGGEGYMPTYWEAKPGAGELAAQRCGLVKNSYGRYVPADVPIVYPGAPVWAGGAATGTPAAVPNYAEPALQTPPATGSTTPTITTAPAGTTTLPTPTPTPPPSTYTDGPRTIYGGGDITQTYTPSLAYQLQTPTGNAAANILPAGVADVFPSWLKDLPIWQTGLAAAAIIYVWQTKKKGRTTR